MRILSYRFFIMTSMIAKKNWFTPGALKPAHTGPYGRAQQAALFTGAKFRVSFQQR
jgi:hypothetical protein